MTDRPILFSGPMVRALLDGRKTQTRRLLKDAPADAGWLCYQKADGERTWIGPNGYPSMPCTLRFAKGDRLWVRETLKDRHGWVYDADDAGVGMAHGDARIPEMIAWAHHKEGDHCVSIHMPRWASRLTLEITNVKVERVQEISEADAIAEGVKLDHRAEQEWTGTQKSSNCHRGRFAFLWDSINAKRDGGMYAWEKNPWVWALEFKRLEVSHE